MLMSRGKQTRTPMIFFNEVYRDTSAYLHVSTLEAICPPFPRPPLSKSPHDLRGLI